MVLKIIIEYTLMTIVGLFIAGILFLLLSSFYYAVVIQVPLEHLPSYVLNFSFEKVLTHPSYSICRF